MLHPLANPPNMVLMIPLRGDLLSWRSSCLSSYHGGLFVLWSCRLLSFLCRASSKICDLGAL